MTRATKGPQRRQRGQIEALPSGACRVKVYAGVDPLSGRRHYLTETIPAGPKAHDRAEEARIRLLSQVQERRNSRTRATVSQLMDRYLELLDAERTTRTRYEIAIRKHIRPLLGKSWSSRAQPWSARIMSSWALGMVVSKSISFAQSGSIVMSAISR